MIQTPLSQICIVDDDRDFVEFLVQFLIAKGLQTKGFETAEELLKSDEIGNSDFFILDLGLPGIDGVDLITLIRARSEAGILVISGRMGPDAFNSALSAGADMFVNKPVRFDQVYNAIGSVCRVTAQRKAGNPAWKLSPARAELTAPDGSTIDLTEVELLLLRRLCDEPQQAVSRQDLADASGIVDSALERNLDSAIFHLRRKIEKAAAQPSPLKTVHGFGFQISKPIEIIE